MMELWLAYGFCGLAVLLAIAFVLIKHPVHAALSFACVVLSAAGVYLLQDAAFVAAATVVVYAGATIIIFMFVLMFAQQTNLLDYDTHKQNPIAAGVVAIALAATVIAVALKELPKLEEQLAAKKSAVEVASASAAAPVTEPAVAQIEADSAKATEEKADGSLALTSGTGLAKDATKESVESDAGENDAANQPRIEEDRFTVAKLGAAFYTRYLLAIEIAGTLLLVATIGAVVIGQREPQADAKEATKT